MIRTIIIKGYFGFGNLGDDLLLVTSWHWLKEKFPEADIIICTESNEPSYVIGLLGKKVLIIRNHERVDADLIVHGGGGIYFDFREGKWWYTGINRLIKMVGPWLYTKLHALYRRARKSRGISGRFRIGVGVGMGTYSRSSNRFYSDITELFDFDYLLVRDKPSIELIRKLGFSYPIRMGSDLAFLTEYWKPDQISIIDSGIVGFVLRDWEQDENRHLDEIKKVADRLRQEGRVVRFYSFDFQMDTHFIQLFSGQYPLDQWNPDHMNLGEFILKLGECSLIVSSRAHGAIVATCMGIPSICIGIEPKLSRISELTKYSSSLIGLPLTAELLLLTIHETLAQHEVLKKAAIRDVAENREKLLEELDLVIEFITAKGMQ